MAKRYEELAFSDDFMFCKIMQNNPDLCRELTELIIGRRIGRIVQLNRQYPIEITGDGRGIRFDVYMEDDENTIYDIEMQAGDVKELPFRTRYYQGMFDLEQLERGAPYQELKNSYIIFICLKNLFPKVGLHKYTFRTACLEQPMLELGDGAKKIILSAEGDREDASEELAAFLQYLSGRMPNSDLTRRLDALVDKARLHIEWRTEYMTLLEKERRAREEGRAEGREEGRAEGREEGLAEGLKKGLSAFIAAFLPLYPEERLLVQKVRETPLYANIPEEDIYRILTGLKEES